MPRPRKGARFGNSGAHEKIILANLARSLFAEGQVITTLAKAKAVRPLAEKLITKARRGDLHSRRTILKTIHDNAVVTKLFDEVAPRYAERPGGYTRITKLGPRRGDGAEEALIELV
jgi:large subunit ribosomal protein L17